MARLFGFDLKKNFAFPYFSRDVAEFWRRWHISLSTWFRDYIYFPLGGSNGGLQNSIRNTIIIFLVSGFWHGANWTYIFWGALNALYFIPLLIQGKNRKHLDVIGGESGGIKIKEVFSMMGTFVLITISWVFFRSRSVTEAFIYLNKMISTVNITQFTDHIYWKWGIHHLILLLFFLIVEWQGRKGEFAIENLKNLKSVFWRWGFYSLIVFLIGVFMLEEGTPFIYFQF